LRGAGRICAFSLFGALLVGCASTAPPVKQELYIVRPQDTVYSIAWRNGLDFRDLARWNNIGPDFRITVGQVLRLTPNGAAASATRPPAPQPRSVPQSPAGSAAPPWAWPIDPVAAPRAVQGGGIILSGRLGQDVRAAAAGRVVYAGTGIRGYGNLIIIKHGENWLSAYAHNRESLVREGQEISSGQVIGHMGEGAPGNPALYFEIRRNGKPVDPLKFLPILK
jgi:lipoprotein NlpD